MFVLGWGIRYTAQLVPSHSVLKCRGWGAERGDGIEIISKTGEGVLLEFTGRKKVVEMSALLHEMKNSPAGCQQCSW